MVCEQRDRVAGTTKRCINKETWRDVCEHAENFREHHRLMTKLICHRCQPSGEASIRIAEQVAPDIRQFSG